MKQLLFLVVLISLLSCKKEIEPDSDPSISNIDTIQPFAEDATIVDVTSSDMPSGKEDWFLNRVLIPAMSTKSLFDAYGTDGFAEFKTKDEYWKDENVRDKFGADYGSEAKMRFDEMYEYHKKEFEDFKLGIYHRSPTGHELIKNDLGY